jgi:alanine racemase
MSEPHPEARAEIVVDLDAIAANVAAVDARVGDAETMAVVKADGYGHGLVEAAAAARSGGATWLGVAVREEALTLRAAGDSGRILTWLAVPGEDYTALVAADVDVTAYSADQVRAVAAAAVSVGRPARLQLKVDTGLNRGGAPPAQWAELYDAAVRAQAQGLLRVSGIWSHLACSDEPDHPANDLQEDGYRQALKRAAAAGLDPGLRHLANSAAALTRPSARFDLVRVGLAAYGLSPVPQLHTADDLGLVPAMTVQARLALVKRVPAGSGVSYGHTWLAPRDTTVGVVPVGYGDGVPRHGSSLAPVWAAGSTRRVAGRVCMDQFMVDLADSDVAAGDPVLLFGADPDRPTAQDWADACGTISYEIVTRVGGRFRRRYTGGGPP